MNSYLTLGLDWLASIVTVVLVLALLSLVVPTVRKRLGFGEDLKKGLVWPLIIGVVSIVVTHTFAKAISESETRAKYVELGIGILSNVAPTKSSRTGRCPELSIDERALRKWAVGIVRAYSDVPMDPLIEERIICEGLKVDKALLGQLGLKLPQRTIDKLQDLGIFPSEVLIER